METLPSGAVQVFELQPEAKAGSWLLVASASCVSLPNESKTAGSCRLPVASTSHASLPADSKDVSRLPVASYSRDSLPRLYPSLHEPHHPHNADKRTRANSTMEYLEALDALEAAYPDLVTSCESALEMVLDKSLILNDGKTSSSPILTPRDSPTTPSADPSAFSSLPPLDISETHADISEIHAHVPVLGAPAPSLHDSAASTAYPSQSLQDIQTKNLYIPAPHSALASTAVSSGAPSGINNNDIKMSCLPYASEEVKELKPFPNRPAEVTASAKSHSSDRFQQPISTSNANEALSSSLDKASVLPSGKHRRAVSASSPGDQPTKRTHASYSSTKSFFPRD
eukprot:g15515.t1